MKYIKLGKFAQRGFLLAWVLLLVVILSILGIASFQTVSISQKNSASSLDRDVALMATELALKDAELDIKGLVYNNAQARNGLYFDPSNNLSFMNFSGNCGSADQIGLCKTALIGGKPLWLKINIDSESVYYGQFTGQVLDIGIGSKVSKKPRYIIQAIPDTAIEGHYIYQITAYGFGIKESTMIVLQTLYRKYNYEN